MGNKPSNRRDESKEDVSPKYTKEKFDELSKKLDTLEGMISIMQKIDKIQNTYYYCIHVNRNYTCQSCKNIYKCDQFIMLSHNDEVYLLSHMPTQSYGFTVRPSLNSIHDINKIIPLFRLQKECINKIITFRDNYVNSGIKNTIIDQSIIGVNSYIELYERIKQDIDSIDKLKSIIKEENDTDPSAPVEGSTS